MSENNTISDLANIFDNIRSNIILKQIFCNLNKNNLLEIIRYNKNLQKRLNIGLIDYIKQFSKIVIELFFSEYRAYPYGRFIRFSKECKSYFHIYFNDNKKEIKTNKINKGDKVYKIKIVIDYGIKSLSKLFNDCHIIKKNKFYQI